MLTVHHLRTSQSERIIWLCEELEIPYDLKVYPRDPGSGLAPAGYKALHGARTSPVITDDEVALAESGAIIEYIVHIHGDGRLAVPPGAAGYADYLFWLHFANGTMMCNELIALVADRLAGEADPVVQALATRRKTAFDLVEQRLTAAPYFAGDSFTAADVIMLFPLTTMRAFVPQDLNAFPRILEYLARIGERPAYRRAMAKGDPGFTPLLS